MKYNRIALLPLLLLIPLLLSSCWDKKELNDMAVVMGVGLDKDPKGGVIVTAQVIKPPAKQGGAAGGSSLPTWSLSERGATVMDAITNLNQISPRRLYWSHMQIIIFDAQLAKEGIAPYINWFSRDSESRTGTYLAVTEGKASDLLNKKIELGNVPSKTMADLIQTSDLRQLPTRKMNMRQFISTLATKGIDPAMDVINIEYVRGKAETYSVQGAALFHLDKLVGFLQRPEVTALEMASNKIRGLTVKVPCPKEKDKHFIYQITDFQNRRKLTPSPASVTMQMSIYTEGNLIDQSCAGDLLNAGAVTLSEQAAADTLKGYLEYTFRKTSEMNSDVFGLGRDFHRFYPQQWRTREADWEQELKSAKLDVQIDAHIRRNGLIVEPTSTKVTE